MSVWSEPTLRELLDRFVPVADDQGRLRGTDAAAEFVRKVTDQGHYGPGFATQQGIYCFTPSGGFLGSCAPGPPDTIRALMERSLERWNALPEPQRRASAGLAPARAWDDCLPAGGLVLRVVARDLEPLPPREWQGGTWIGRRRSVEVLSDGIWNLDHAWFSRDEVRRWFDPGGEPGRVHIAPNELVCRLATVHLVDSVNGRLPMPFLEEEVAGSRMFTEVVSRAGTRVRLRITGNTSASTVRDFAHRSARSIETRLFGYAEFDEETQSFVSFDVVALGARSRFRPFLYDEEWEGWRAIGFVLTLDDPTRPPVPPHFIDRYGVSWAVGPEGGRKRVRGTTK
ncbi:hypothetical protein K8I85_02165 [bacterium]|nr:hypothetical protein [bacterium]